MSFFDLQERLKRRAYQSFNVASDVAFWLNAPLKSQLNKNTAYKNVHRGDRCFILGTGPSLNMLNEEQIKFLSHEKLIGVNSLYKAAICSNLSPKYYVLMDNKFWGESSHAFAEIAQKYADDSLTFITDYRARSFIPKGRNKLLIYAKNYPTHKMRFDLSKNLSITMNVVGFALSSAIYLGFKEIFLLGCDYNLFCLSQNKHCHEDPVATSDFSRYNLGFYLNEYALTTRFHYTIQKSASALGVKIVNLTPGSLLDAYPTDSIQSLMK